MESETFSFFVYNLLGFCYLMYKSRVKKKTGMKRIFLIIIIALISTMWAESCYKDIQRENRTDILINHTWYLRTQSVGGYPETDSCQLSEVLTFKKDSTGNHHYNYLCDANGPHDLSFKWTIPGQWVYMYYSKIGGKKDSNLVYSININNDDTLKIGTVVGGVTHLSMYTSFQ